MVDFHSHTTKINGHPSTIHFSTIHQDHLSRFFFPVEIEHKPTHRTIIASFSFSLINTKSPRVPLPLIQDGKKWVETGKLDPCDEIRTTFIWFSQLKGKGRAQRDKKGTNGVKAEWV